ncbi:MAG TPA: hypothetical protein VKB39_01610, partial [Candidatus Baltobacteraceae bacterium]|nr:hypothetical protein [Candidatus Baltobacteraceae bacterium]
TVASSAAAFSKVVARMEPVMVNGTPGILSWLPNGEPLSIMGFVVAGDRISEIYVISQPERVRQLVSNLS